MVLALLCVWRGGWGVERGELFADVFFASFWGILVFACVCVVCQLPFVRTFCCCFVVVLVGRYADRAHQRFG